MDLTTRFRDDELERIADEAMLYLCACPGQVAAEIGRLRELIRYQRRCLTQPGAAPEVHQCIANAALRAHTAMEDCLDEVLRREGWDRATLKMPPGLRRLRDELLDGDLG